MYGTVARIRPKAGSEKALIAMMDEWRKSRKAKVKGAVATYTYKLDRDPGTLLMAVVFQDKKTYRANADDPEQDKWFGRIAEHFAGEPEWNDGQIVAGA